MKAARRAEISRQAAELARRRSEKASARYARRVRAQRSAEPTEDVYGAAVRVADVSIVRAMADLLTTDPTLNGDLSPRLQREAALTARAALDVFRGER